METKKRLRTWSDFGNLRRVPTEYEIVTHNLTYSARPGRAAALEEGPASPANRWIRTYRDESPLQADDWNAFRDPHQLTYRKYVALQDESETVIASLLDKYSDARHDDGLDAAWVGALARTFTPLRYPLHAFQMCASYVGQIAPTSYVTNAAAFTAADMLRGVSLVAYRTRELQAAHPGAGFATGERAIWETDANWQPLRRALERALVVFDWAESFCAVNLVLRPAFDAYLYGSLAEVARENGDELTWLLLANLRADGERCRDWSIALARFAHAQRAGNPAVLRDWLEAWEPAADEIAEGLSNLLAAHSRSAAGDVVKAALAARANVAEKVFG
jgi:toluene monooxygenase system protein E